MAGQILLLFGALVMPYLIDMGSDGYWVMKAVAAALYIGSWAWFTWRIIRHRDADAVFFSLLAIGYAPWRDVVEGTVWATVYWTLVAFSFVFVAWTFGRFLILVARGRSPF